MGRAIQSKPPPLYALTASLQSSSTIRRALAGSFLSKTVGSASRRSGFGAPTNLAPDPAATSVSTSPQAARAWAGCASGPGSPAGHIQRPWSDLDLTPPRRWGDRTWFPPAHGRVGEFPSPLKRRMNYFESMVVFYLGRRFGRLDPLPDRRVSHDSSVRR